LRWLRPSKIYSRWLHDRGDNYIDARRNLEGVHWLPRIALVSFVIGLILVAIGIGHVDGAARWFRSGAVGCLIAYFLVLFDNFKRKVPLQTRGGPVRREGGAVKYALPYVILMVIGFVTLQVILTTPRS
jgi:hypothetical protein